MHKIMDTSFVCDSIKAPFNFYTPRYWYGLEQNLLEHSDKLNQALDNIEQHTFNPDTTTTLNNWERIHEQLQDIYVNGTGYNDIVSVICIPLIIALFAFSFPFIFQMINHINDKYASKSISLIFSSSKTYKFFRIVNSLSIFYVLIFGVMTILWKEFILITHLQLLNWVTITVAFIYTFAIISFVNYCIKFNNPDKLVEIIKNRYQNERRWTTIQQKKISCKVLIRRLLKHKDTVGNMILHSAKSYVNNWYNVVPNDNYITRLIAIVTYSVKSNDFGLFQNVLEALDFIIDEEKNSTCTYSSEKSDVIKEASNHRLTIRFFKEFLISYIPFKNFNMHEEMIISKLLGAFDKTKYLNYGDSLQLAQCMLKMIEGEHMTFLEKYVDKSSYYFKYICTLPKISFIKCGCVDERPKVEEKSVKCWNNLCSLHYAVLAYAFDKDYFSILSFHKEKDYKSINNLYPIYGSDILIRYAYCLKSDKYGYDQLFDRDLDVKKILSKYTTALLLIIHNLDETITETVTNEIIDVIENSKSNLDENVDIIKSNAQLRHIYPHLADVDWNERFNFFLGIIKSKWVFKNKPRKELKSCSFVNVLCKLIGLNNARIDREGFEAKSLNLYTLRLNENIKRDFHSKLNSFNLDISRYLPNGLINAQCNKQTEEKIVGPCQLLVYKPCFLFENYYNHLNLYGEYLELFGNRITYLALSAFREMNIKEYNVTSVAFNLFFEEFTHGKRTDYVLIGVESPFHAILNIQFKGNKLTYGEDVLYIDIRSPRVNLLTDLEDYSFFKDKLIIVAKQDLPAMIDIGEKDEIGIDYNDISNEKKLDFAVRITVDISKKIVFNPNANIAVVRLKKMSL